jgi:hypothetical protein
MTGQDKVIGRLREFEGLDLIGLLWDTIFLSLSTLAPFVQDTPCDYPLSVLGKPGIISASV